jgi:endoglucanase
MMRMEILRIKPVFKETVWGGKRLHDDFGYDIMSNHIGECWAVSAHPDGEGRIDGGTFDGMRLSELWKTHPELFGNFDSDRFPLLTKIIDANADLSIQVHPDDAYAAEHENGSLGKTECWYIIDCAPGATIIIGHNAQTREELKKMVAEGSWKELLREVPIKKGDFFQIDPGTIHAIKAGTLILESQQSSDITYRLYDYDRLQNGKKRPLHIEKSLDVIKVPFTEQKTVSTKSGSWLTQLHSCDCYKIWKGDLDGKETLRPASPFMIGSVLSGEATLGGVTFKKGDHFIIPYGHPDIQLSGKAECIFSAPTLREQTLSNTKKKEISRSKKPSVGVISGTWHVQRQGAVMSKVKKAKKKIAQSVLTTFLCISLIVGLVGCTGGTQGNPGTSVTGSEAVDAADTSGSDDTSTANASGQNNSGAANASGQDNSGATNASEQDNSGSANASGQDNSGASGSETEDEESGLKIPDISIEKKTVPDTDSMRFVKDLKIGVSLGNTFDAYKDSGLSDEMKTETAWVSVKTSQSMIKAFHEAGFETIRIPVSWHNHVDKEYNISEKWMSRVQQVVDWAIEEGMYVILNIHHDNHPEANGFYPDNAHREQSVSYIKAIWSQLAERYKDYDEHLIFESMNEPRLVGHEHEWWIPTWSDDVKESILCINELNQLFVDTVRAAGGFNAKRYLMCPGYDASPEGALHREFVLPTDTPELEDANRIIVSVHAYTPYDFALNLSGTSYFSSQKQSSTRDIDSFMDRLYTRYVEKGIPVVIGEFGALDKKNLEERVDYAAYYIASAKARGMTAMWWDNNSFSGNGENFGLLYRTGGYIVYEDIVNALMKYAE